MSRSSVYPIHPPDTLVLLSVASATCRTNGFPSPSTYIYLARNFEFLGFRQVTTAVLPPASAYTLWLFLTLLTSSAIGQGYPFLARATVPLFQSPLPTRPFALQLLLTYHLLSLSRLLLLSISISLDDQPRPPSLRCWGLSLLLLLLLPTSYLSFDSLAATRILNP